MITNENLYLFNKLRTKRLKGWETFSDPEYVNMFKSQIQKYAEPAHFIYELIQNADDALATEVSITLFSNHLVFKHNGIHHLTITDVDKLQDGIGDVNSLTAIAYSSKTGEENKIGKFGIGFMSVFQYTQTPTIYDDNFWFKIENYMIPELLYQDHPLRNEGETLFDIVFKQPEMAYKEICGRLQNLNMPALFLPNIVKISWKIDGEDVLHTYSKTILQARKKNDFYYELCSIKEYDKSVNLYLFKQRVKVSNGEEKEICVGYFLKNDGTLDIDIRPSIYCFFPTREKFDSCFISHAPFMLTDSREGFLPSEEAINNEYLHHIAELAAKALLLLRDNKGPNGKYLINDNLYPIINVKSLEERNVYLKTQYVKIVNSAPLILSRSNKYIETNKALVTTDDLQQLINKKQINQLFDNGFDFVYVNNYRSELRIAAYELGIATFNAESLAMKLTPTFMGSQPKGWINKLISYIKENARKLWNTDKVRIISSSYYHKSDSWENLKFRFAPIAKTNEGEWVAPYTKYKEKANVMLPFNGIEDATEYDFELILDKKLYETHKDFYDQIGLRKPNDLDYIEKVILPKYQKEDNISFEILKNDFQSIVNLYQKSKDKNQIRVILRRYYRLVCLRDEKYLLFSIEENSLYLDTDDLIRYFGGKDSRLFVETDVYFREDGDLSKDDIQKFFVEVLGVNDCSIVILDEIRRKHSLPTSVKEMLEETLRNDRRSLSNRYDPYFKDYYLDGYDITKITGEWSHLMWGFLSKNYRDEYGSAILKYREKYATKLPKEIRFQSTLIKRLKTDKWIYGNGGKFFAPSEITIGEFIELGYNKCDKLTSELCFCTDIKESKNNPNYEQNQIDIKEKEEYTKKTDELLKMASEKGIDVNAVLQKAIQGDCVIGSVDNMEDLELPTIETEIDDKLLSISTSIEDIDLSYFDYFKNHEADIVDYIDGLDRPKSMIRSTIGIIGRLIYEQYLIDNNIPYEKAEGSEVMYYDYKIKGEEQYVTIRTTEKSIIDRNFDIGLRAAQNAFLKEHPNAQFRMVRISISDINVEPEYKEIIGLYGKEIDPSMDDRFLKNCKKLAQNYWKGATITDFDEASPEYLIKIERKN